MYTYYMYYIYKNTVKIYHINHELNTYIQGNLPSLLYLKNYNGRDEVLEMDYLTDKLYYYYFIITCIF